MVSITLSITISQVIVEVRVVAGVDCIVSRVLKSIVSLTLSEPEEPPRRYAETYRLIVSHHQESLVLACQQYRSSCVVDNAKTESVIDVNLETELGLPSLKR